MQIECPKCKNKSAGGFIGVFIKKAIVKCLVCSGSFEIKKKTLSTQATMEAMGK